MYFKIYFTRKIFLMFSQCGLHYKHYYRATFKHDYEEWVDDTFYEYRN